MQILQGRGERRGQAGMTLLEISIASVLILIVSAVLAQFSDTSGRAYGTLNRSEEVNRRAWRGIEDVARKLRTASWDTLTGVDQNFSKEVIFAPCLGFDEEPQLGDMQRIGFRYSAADPDDGVDNDGNGLVDDGELVWVLRPGEADERTRVLCRWVPEALEGEIPGNLQDDNGNGFADEHGFAVRVAGDSLEMHLTVARPDPSGQLIQRTMRRTLVVRMGENTTNPGGDGQEL